MKLNYKLAYRLVVLAIIVIGLSTSAYIGLYIKQSSENSFIERVNTLSRVISSEGISQLKGDSADLQNPTYQKIKDLLISIRSVNHDIRFIYLNGLRDSKMFFFVDSEIPSSNDYSPPGQSYDEATPFMYNVFSDNKNYLDISRDRWGYWLSAYAPIFDKQNGRVVALIGIDIPGNPYILNIIANSALPLLVTIVLLVILYFAKRAHDKEKAYLDKKSQFLSMVTHDIRNPLTGIKWSTESLSKDQSINDKNRQALTDMNKVSTDMIDKINNFKF